MIDATIPPQHRPEFERRRPSHGASLRTAAGMLVVSGCVVAGAWMLEQRFAIPPRPIVAQVAAPKPAPPAAPAASNTYTALLDPAYALGSPPVALDRSSPLAADFVPAQRPVAMASAAPAAIEAPEPDAVIPLPGLAVPPLVESAPLPIPRPAALAARIEPGPVAAPRRRATQNRTVVARSAPPDNRSFFEKLFGVQQPAGPALAYAAPEETVVGRSQRLTPEPVSSSYDRQTAVYDIAAHTVYLPNGTTLEAHSGLGDMLDDPRHVSQRNRGPTPPQLYELRPREQLFHGVRALRLNPVGGGGTFGRNGLLAHTFMLGPNGDSNGCVSFRNYDAFLQAYTNGEVKRLAVVARR